MSREVSEKELLQRLAALPREIGPERDPWLGIEARIKPSIPWAAGRASKRSWSVVAVAASVLLALFVVFKPVHDDPGQAPRVADEPAGRQFDAAISELRWKAGEMEYLAALREVVALHRADGRLPLSALENVRAGWLELQAVEAELQSALRQYPDDRFLNDRMLELRSRQLDFMKQIVAVDRGLRSDMI